MSFYDKKMICNWCCSCYYKKEQFRDVSFRNYLISRLFSVIMRCILSFYIMLFFTVVTILSGCGPSTIGQLQKKSAAKQLPAAEIISMASGNTLFLHGHKVDSYFYFDASGNTFAKDIFNNNDTGLWDVSSEEELCFKMNNWWLKNLRCFVVYKDGEKYYLFNSSGVLEFSAEYFEGDSKNLYRELAKPEKKFLLTEVKAAKKSMSAEPVKSEEPIIETATDTTQKKPSEEELKSTVKWMAKDCPGCNLEKANLANAELIGAQLKGADLSGANLSKANLRRANLQDTDLKNADLSYANLPGANLRDSDLKGANFTGANLIRADFTGADIDGAIFTEALLEGVEGLER